MGLIKEGIIGWAQHTGAYYRSVWTPKRLLVSAVTIILIVALLSVSLVFAANTFSAWQGNWSLSHAMSMDVFTEPRYFDVLAPGVQSGQRFELQMPVSVQAHLTDYCVVTGLGGFMESLMDEIKYVLEYTNFPLEEFLELIDVEEWLDLLEGLFRSLEGAPPLPGTLFR